MAETNPSDAYRPDTLSSGGRRPWATPLVIVSNLRETAVPGGAYDTQDIGPTPTLGGIYNPS